MPFLSPGGEEKEKGTLRGERGEGSCNNAEEDRMCVWTMECGDQSTMSTRRSQASNVAVNSECKETLSNHSNLKCVQSAVQLPASGN